MKGTRSDANGKWQRLRSSFSEIGRLRDTILVCAGLFYIVGYAAWSYLAYREGLGSLPVLDFQ